MMRGRSSICGVDGRKVRRQDRRQLANELACIVLGPTWQRRVGRVTGLESSTGTTRIIYGNAATFIRTFETLLRPKFALPKRIVKIAHDFDFRPPNWQRSGRPSPPRPKARRCPPTNKCNRRRLEYDYRQRLHTAASETMIERHSATPSQDSTPSADLIQRPRRRRRDARITR